MVLISIMFWYSILVACSMNLLHCVDILPAKQFTEPRACAEFIVQYGYNHMYEDPNYPIIMGRCIQRTDVYAEKSSEVIIANN